MLGVRASVSQAPRATVLAGSPGLQSAPGFAGEPDPTGCGSPCSDPVVPIAVGPGVVVQVGPSGFRFFNKGGELLLKLGYPDFFGISATGSPKIVYDQLHGRWVAAATDPSACSPGFLLGISDTSDPTGGWTIYDFSTGSLWPALTGMGLSSDKVVLGMFEFNMTDCNMVDPAGGRLVEADMAALLATPQSLAVAQSSLDVNQLQWQPAMGLTSGNEAFAIGMNQIPSVGWDVSLARMTGTSAASTLALTISDLTTSLGLSGFTNNAPAATNAFWRAGDLWFQSGTQSGVRVTEVVTTDSPSVAQDFEIGQDGIKTSLGAIGLAGDGTLFVTFTQASVAPTTFGFGPESLYAAYQAPSDPANTIHAQALIVGGAAPYNDPHWGDYTSDALAPDPSDVHGIWQGGPYTTPSGDWASWISKLTAASGALDGSMVLDDGRAQTNSLTLALGAQPLATSPTTQVLISNSATISGSQLAQAIQIPSAVRTAWDLANAAAGGTTATGLRTVYYQWGDGAGAWSAVASSSITVDTPLGATYDALPPARLLDTRTGNGLSGPFHSTVPRAFQVSGRGGVPSAAVAVTGNLTVTGQTSAGYVFLGPSASSTPSSSTINFPLGDNRANGLTVKLGSGGKLSAVFIGGSSATTQLIFDVTGYFLAGDSGATYIAINPVRIIDSRTYGSAGKLQSRQWSWFIVGGIGGVPADALAVTGNVTVTQQTSGGYIFVGPSGGAGLPSSSTLNFPVGDNRANNLTVALGRTSELWIIFVGGSTATTHFVFDATGYFMAAPGGATYVPLTPARLLDTRTGNGLSGPLQNRIARSFQVSGRGGVPSLSLAVTGNLTVTKQTAAGYVFLGPNPTNSPTSSTLNFPVGDNRANGVSVALGAGGTLSATYAASVGATTHLIFDVTGFYR